MADIELIVYNKLHSELDCRVEIQNFTQEYTGEPVVIVDLVNERVTGTVELKEWVTKSVTILVDTYTSGNRARMKAVEIYGKIDNVMENLGFKLDGRNKTPSFLGKDITRYSSVYVASITNENVIF